MKRIVVVLLVAAAVAAAAFCFWRYWQQEKDTMDFSEDFDI